MLCKPKHYAVNTALRRNPHRIEETCPCHGPFVEKSVASQGETLDAALSKHGDLQQVINAIQRAVNGELRVVIALQAKQAVAFCHDGYTNGNLREGHKRSRLISQAASCLSCKLASC